MLPKLKKKKKKIESNGSVYILVSPIVYFYMTLKFGTNKEYNI